MKLNQTLCSFTLMLGLACVLEALPVTVTTNSSAFTVDLQDVNGASVIFEPNVPPENLGITADFDAAVLNTPFNGVLSAFNFVTAPTNFNTGLYRVSLILDPGASSPTQITLTGPDTFQASVNANLIANFTFVGASSGGGSSGDVDSEFGSLPGFDNCVNINPTSTCDLAGAFTLTGNYSSGPTAISGVTVSAGAIPEPSSFLLVALGAAGLLLRRRVRSY